MIISGVVDDVLIQCFQHDFINNRLKDIEDNKPTDPDFQLGDFQRYTKSLTIKQLLIYSNEELYNKYIGYQNQINLLKQKTISAIVKEEFKPSKQSTTQFFSLIFS